MLLGGARDQIHPGVDGPRAPSRGHRAIHDQPEATDNPSGASDVNNVTKADPGKVHLVQHDDVYRAETGGQPPRGDLSSLNVQAHVVLPNSRNGHDERVSPSLNVNDQSP